MANEQSASSNQTFGTGLGPCPECGAVCVVKIGEQKKCNKCGLQWPPVSQMQRGPTRQEILNGIARYGPGRIIFFRTC